MFPLRDNVRTRSVPLITWGLIALNTLIFVYEASLPGQTVQVRAHHEELGRPRDVRLASRKLRDLAAPAGIHDSDKAVHLSRGVGGRPLSLRHQPLEHFFHTVGKRLVGVIAAGEQRVAAIGRDRHAAQDRGHRRVDRCGGHGRARTSAGVSVGAPAAAAEQHRAEMAKPENARTIELLAVFSHHANFSVGCYCENEAHCHRSVLRELLREKGAVFA